MARFNRILLKLSGESLMGKQGYGIDPERLSDYAKQIKEISEMGVQIGIVIGGGNIFRGLSGSQKGFDRVKGDQMGMCATVINSLALSSALGAIGVKNKVLTAIRMEPIGEFYTKWKAIEAMDSETVGTDYRSRLYRRDGFYDYRDVHGDFQAKLLNVLDDGRLVLLDTEGTARLYAFKEVQYII